MQMLGGLCMTWGYLFRATYHSSPEGTLTQSLQTCCCGAQSGEAPGPDMAQIWPTTSWAAGI